MDNKILLSELAEKLAVQSEISKRAAESFLRTFFSLIEQNMLSDRFVKIKDIGTFKLVDVNERESVNVATGERIQIEGHSKISFTAEGKLRDLVNRPFAYLTNIELEEETTIEELNNVDNSVAVADTEKAPQQDVTEEAATKAPVAFASVTPPVQEGSPFLTQDVENLAEEVSPRERELAAQSPVIATPTTEAPTPETAAVPYTASLPSSEGLAHTIDAQPASPNSQAQEIALALLKIIQTAQGSHLTPQELVSAFQTLQSTPATEPAISPALENAEEEVAPSTLNRRDRRRTRREGKRMRNAPRQGGASNMEVSATAVPGIHEDTVMTNATEAPEVPTVEHISEETTPSVAIEEEVQRPIRLKDRQNRQRRNRRDIKRASASVNNGEESSKGATLAENTEDTPLTQPIETESVETVPNAEQPVPDEPPSTTDELRTEPTALTEQEASAPIAASQPDALISQDVVASLQEIMQSPSDLMAALQEVTQSPQEVMQVLQELAHNTPSADNQPSALTADTPSEQTEGKSHSALLSVSEVQSEEEYDEEDDNDEEDEEKSRFKKIGIIVAIALLLLGIAFYFLYFHEPQKDLIEDPLGLEQVKKANAADNINADTIRADEINGIDSKEDGDGINDDTYAPQDIKQLPNAGYEILGTYKEYTLKQGESLGYVALKAYGSGDLINYIIFYNDLTNISNLGPGSKIKIPTLRRKSTGEIINKK